MLLKIIRVDISIISTMAGKYRGSAEIDNSVMNRYAKQNAGNGCGQENLVNGNSKAKGPGALRPACPWLAILHVKSAGALF